MPVDPCVPVRVGSDEEVTKRSKDVGAGRREARVVLDVVRLRVLLSETGMETRPEVWVLSVDTPVGKVEFPEAMPRLEVTPGTPVGTETPVCVGIGDPAVGIPSDAEMTTEPVVVGRVVDEIFDGPITLMTKELICNISDGSGSDLVADVGRASDLLVDRVDVGRELADVVSGTRLGLETISEIEEALVDTGPGSEAAASDDSGSVDDAFCVVFDLGDIVEVGWVVSGLEVIGAAVDAATLDACLDV